MIIRALAIVLVLSFSACSKHDRQSVIDCRDAAMRVAAKYGEEWEREAHFNQREQRCYLSLEGREASTLNDGTRMYSHSEILMDVDNNLEIAGCAATWERGTPETPLCTEAPSNSITRDHFLEIRNRFLERMK